MNRMGRAVEAGGSGRCPGGQSTRARKRGGGRVQQSGEDQLIGGGWRGGRMQDVRGGERMIQKTVGNGGAGTRLGCNNKRHSLGLEQSLSKVGTPPPRNLDTLHRLVAGQQQRTTYHTVLTQILAMGKIQPLAGIAQSSPKHLVASKQQAVS